MQTYNRPLKKGNPVRNMARQKGQRTHYDAQTLIVELDHLKEKYRNLMNEHINLKTHCQRQDLAIKKRDRNLHRILDVRLSGLKDIHEERSVLMKLQKIKSELKGIGDCTIKIHDLQEQVEEKDEELKVVYSSMQFTMLKELQHENKVFYGEVQRLNRRLAHVENELHNQKDINAELMESNNHHKEIIQAHVNRNASHSHGGDEHSKRSNNMSNSRSSSSNKLREKQTAKAKQNASHSVVSDSTDIKEDDYKPPVAQRTVISIDNSNNQPTSTQPRKRDGWAEKEDDTIAGLNVSPTNTSPQGQSADFRPRARPGSAASKRPTIRSEPPEKSLSKPEPLAVEAPVSPKTDTIIKEKADPPTNTTTTTTTPTELLGSDSQFAKAPSPTSQSSQVPAWLANDAPPDAEESAQKNTASVAAEKGEEDDPFGGDDDPFAGDDELFGDYDME